MTLLGVLIGHHCLPAGGLSWENIWGHVFNHIQTYLSSIFRSSAFGNSGSTFSVLFALQGLSTKATIIGFLL